MCGICGIISENPTVDLAAVKRMQDAMLHRGPDGAGDFSDDHVGIAMRRLSIIDLAGGWQPLYNEDHSLALVANGEIYNYVELQAVLKAHGHRFSTNTDVETILHLYEEYGIDCVTHLRGMFAFALWDGKLRRVLLARDRMGEKPLYLCQQGNELIFASELRAILKSGRVCFDLDPTSVDLYFHYQYVPEPATMIKGVRKLGAGHMLVVGVDPWHTSERCYWRIEDAPPLEGDPGELIREELETIGEMVIRADVPVGVALSGGMDSSAIAVVAKSRYHGTMHAFTVGYEGRPDSDEREDARALAGHLQIPFHEVELKLDEIVDFFPELVCLRDDPIADISGHGYYAVMKLAREHDVPVVLQGQGGDELFWGYPIVRQAAYQSIQKDLLAQARWLALVDSLRLEVLTQPSRSGLRDWARLIFGSENVWKRFKGLKGSPPDRLVFYDLWPGFQQAVENVRTLYSPGFIERLDGITPFDLFTVPRPWRRTDILLTRLICQSYLLENGIAQGDRLSMASSVELRLPLVDYRLVETVIGLRKSYEDYRLPQKAWLKEAVKDILPGWVMSRRKRGFEPPVIEWEKALLKTYGSMLIEGFLADVGVILPESGKCLASGKISLDLCFKALVLEIWCRRLRGGY